ncbi:P-loop NTPase fold protein [Aeromonas sp. A5]|uniref:P-loop NTPase fold protein n=1 Tax=unclassified Aeromonas TaxID=257493 RepID=UPI00377044B0
MSKNINFSIEEPASVDLFSGNGHISSARAIKRTIELHSDLNIIGLEGELGAGKSSIIKMLEMELDERYKFISFDISTYYHTSFKSEFIKFFSTSLKECFNNEIDNNAIDSATNKALGKTFSYEKNTQSNISWLVFAFAISIIFSVRYFNNSVDILIDTIEMLRGNLNYSFSLKATITCLLGLSPFIIAIGNTLNNAYKRRKGKLTFSLGDLLKRNSLDRITETLLVNKEVGGFELKKAFSEMLKTIPNNRILILVLDNIDRIEVDKLGEIWSDIDIFSNVQTGNLKIILPFSERHVSKALNKDDPAEGKEYISKKLPVVFKAPPVVTANWRELFDHISKGTIADYDGIDACKNLISLWMQPGNMITPRFIKRHINDIASILSCNSQIKDVAICSAYILTCKNNDIDISILLSPASLASTGNEDDTIHNKALVRRKRQIENTHRILDSLKERDEWTTELACIHFQTTKEIAKSELLYEPIKNGFTNNTPSDVIDMSSIYGYDIAFEKISNEFGYIECINFCAAALEENNKNIEWINKWIPKFNTFPEAIVQLKAMDETFINSIIKLQKQGIKPRLDPIIQYKNKIEEKNNQINEIEIRELYHCHSTLQSNNHLPVVIKNPTSDNLLVLWRNRKIFTNWNIEDLITDVKINIKAIEILLAENKLDYSFMRWCIKSFRLENTKIFERIESPDDISISLDSSTKNADALMCLIYTNEWYKNDFINELINMYDKVLIEEINELDVGQSEELFSVWAAIISAQVIKNNHYNSNFNYYDFETDTYVTDNAGQMINALILKSDTNKYGKYLAQLLVATPYFSDLYKALTSPIKEQIKDSVRIFITNGNNYYALEIKTIVHAHYQVYRSLLSNDEASYFINELYRWFHLYRKQIDISLWSPKFILDALTLSSNKWGIVFENSITELSSNTSFWDNELKTPSEYISIYLDWVEENKRPLPNQPQIVSAMKELYKDRHEHEANDSDSEKHIYRIATLLDNKNKGALKRYLSNQVMLANTNQAEKIAIVSTFNDLVKLKTINDENIHESYILFIESTIDERVLTWIDSQSLKLEQWSNENIANLTSILSSSPYKELCQQQLKLLAIQQKKLKPKNRKVQNESIAIEE